MHSRMLVQLIRPLKIYTSVPVLTLSLTSLANSPPRITGRRRETRFYTQRGETHSLANENPNVLPRESSGSKIVSEVPGWKVSLEKRRRAGFPSLTRGRETMKRAGYPNLKKGIERQKGQGYPGLKKVREKQKGQGYPNLEKGRETQKRLKYPNLKKGNEKQKGLGYPSLKEGREKQERLDYPGLEKARAKRLPQLIAQRALAGRPPKKRLKIPCSTCSKVFETNQGLAIHVSVRHEGLRYRCDFSGCGMIYCSAAGLRHHGRKFHGILMSVPEMPTFDPSKGT